MELWWNGRYKMVTGTAPDEHVGVRRLNELSCDLL